MTDSDSERLSTANLTWTDEGTPFSRQFGDIYFSRENGIQETEYVFLEHNLLGHRLKTLDHESGDFTIGETGFGSGLNFLCAWQLRDQVAPNCHLNFVSVEKYPLTRDDLSKALGFWPELSEYADLLIAQYPILTPGWHRIRFLQQRVDLTLFLGDALNGYSNFQGKIDAWFLDGFAPAKNQPMWSPPLFNEISRLSAAGASFSTFTAAAQVREGMKKAGFKVERVKGFANKRHMLRGDLIEPSQQLSDYSASAPWFNLPKQTGKTRTAVVIGAGMAGTSAAHSLASRGWQVTLLEQSDKIADGASGNRQGILYCKLSSERSIQSDFYQAGYLYTSQQLPQLLGTDQEKIYWQKCGVLQLAYNSQETERQSRFVAHNPQPETLVYPVSPQQASAIAGVGLDEGGLFYPEGAWVTPAALCQAHAAHPNVTVCCGSGIARIERAQEIWKLVDQKDNVIAESEVVIIANAHDALRFEQTKFLPLKAIRGQTTEVPGKKQIPLKTVLCGKGYIGPVIDDNHHIGATFNLRCYDNECRPKDHRTNLDEITGLAPELAKKLAFEQLDIEKLSGRVGFRCASPDYLPLVGPVPDYAAFMQDYAPLRKDASQKLALPARYLPGLYITAGHGSKGLTSCPLAGELLAAYISQSVFPLATNLTHALHPGRFIIRDLMRNKR